MAEVDTIFTIRQPYTLLYMTAPFLQELGIADPKKLLEFIRSKNPKISVLGKKSRIDEVVESAFANAAEPRKSARMEKYRQHAELLLKELKEGNSFDGTVPFFVNGLCISSYNSAKKTGVDPYSNLHMFSNQLIELAGEFGFPKEFLSQFRFCYVQPVPYIQRVVEKDGCIGLEDVLKDAIVSGVSVEGIGFGTLAKFDDITPKIGNSVYSQGLLSLEHEMPEIIATQHESEMSFEDRVDLKRTEIFFNRNLMNIKYAYMLEKIFPKVIASLKRFGLRGIPLYMEKGSDSAKVLNYSSYYTDSPIVFHFVGGEQGIIANTPEKIPISGICHPTALGRLFGMLENMHMTWSGNFGKKKAKIKEAKSSAPVRYASTAPFKFLLLEEGTEERHPNLHDIAREHLSDYEKQLVKEFAYFYRVGFARVEPRLVTLFRTDSNVYNSFRSLDKTNRRWFQEIDGKKIVTANMMPGFADIPSIREAEGDFRGSQLSLPTSPKINDSWISRFREGDINVGCSIEKLISGMGGIRAIGLLREILKSADTEVVAEFNKFHDAELRSIPAMRGSAIHKISSLPIDGLVHYETLAAIGLEGTSSGCYCETPFSHSLDIAGVKFTATMHPDAYIFLQRGEKEYDLVIFDTKTNRVTPYPEHKYLQQTFFYGWMLKHIVQEELGINIVNIYSVLNKNAFHRGFEDKPKKPTAHSWYREQKYSPITLFAPEDIMFEAMPKIVGKIVREKQELRQDAGKFEAYKKAQSDCGMCKKCYLSHRLLCDYADSMGKQGKFDLVF